MSRKVIEVKCASHPEGVLLDMAHIWSIVRMRAAMNSGLAANGGSGSVVSIPSSKKLPALAINAQLVMVFETEEEAADIERDFKWKE